MAFLLALPPGCWAGQLALTHRVTMYYIETKAICCHQQFGQFLGLHQTGGVGVGIFVDSIFIIFTSVLLTKIETVIMYNNLHFYYK